MHLCQRRSYKFCSLNYICQRMAHITLVVVFWAKNLVEFNLLYKWRTSLKDKHITNNSSFISYLSDRFTTISATTQLLMFSCYWLDNRNGIWPIKNLFQLLLLRSWLTFYNSRKAGQLKMLKNVAVVPVVVFNKLTEMWCKNGGVLGDAMRVMLWGTWFTKGDWNASVYCLNWLLDISNTEENHYDINMILFQSRYSFA